MVVKEEPSPPGEAAPAAPRPGAAATGLDALVDAMPLAAVLERGPVVRLAPAGGGPPAALAAERLAVSRRALAARLAAAGADDGDLLRHAEDRIAARLLSGLARTRAPAEPLLAGLPARVPVLLPLPHRPPPPQAPRPGLIGVLPLAAAASVDGATPAARRAGLASSGWRLAIGELDAAALRFVAPAALGADLLLVRWSLELPGQRDALRGADPHSLVLAGCDGPDAVAWGLGAGLALFSGPAAEATLAAAAGRGP